MVTQSFVAVLNQEPDDDELNALYEAGCDDATFGIERGLPVAEFNREASSLADAIVSALHDVESVDGFTIIRVVDEDLLTLADIADRIGQSRESIRRYAAGVRGPGGFPPPINPNREGTIFYRWSEVAPWLREHVKHDIPNVEATLVVANLLLQARQHRGQVTHMSTLNTLLAA